MTREGPRRQRALGVTVELPQGAPELNPDAAAELLAALLDACRERAADPTNQQRDAA